MQKGKVMIKTGNLFSTSVYQILCNVPCMHYYFLLFSQQLYEVARIIISTFLVRKWKHGEFIQLGRFKFGNGCLGIPCMHFPLCYRDSLQ